MRRTNLSLVLGIFVACSKGAAPDAYGNVEATEVVVAAQGSGQLTTFMPREGAKVAQGAVVAEVDTVALALQVAQGVAQRTAGSARVDAAAQQVAVIDAQLVISRRTLERTRRLFAEQAATAQQLDQAERDYRTLVAQRAAAEAQRAASARELASNDVQVARWRDQLAKSRVVNPVSGTVLVTYAHAGEVVQAGQPLYKIANLDTVELRAYVNEADLARVRVGSSAEVTVDASGGGRRTIGGTVSWVASQGEFTPTPIQTRDERTNLVYAVKVRVPNRDGALKIGMPADVQFAARTAQR